MAVGRTPRYGVRLFGRHENLADVPVAVAPKISVVRGAGIHDLVSRN